VTAPLALLAFAMILRIVDIFVLRLDERLGEIILSKSLRLLLDVGYTWWVGQNLSAIGFHSRRLGSALALGAGLTGAAVIIATIVQMLALAPGQWLTLQAVDLKTSMTGNVINSFMEEGLS